MKYMAIFDDDFLQYFRRDDNGMTLVVNDRDGLTRAVRLQPLEERPHGEWVNYVDDFGNHVVMCTRCCITNEYDSGYCPHCGASMSANDRQVTGKLNSEIEKLKSEIENSDLPERFTSTDCSCLNCKNRHSVHCESQNKKIYGYCGNWERR